MDAFWNFIAAIFQAIFSVMSKIGYGFNVLIISIGFISFFLWVNYMSRQKEVEKFD